jgi:S-adenosylmethionine decarboxylase
MNTINNNWKNLAPDLCRQRVIIEAVTDHCVTEKEIIDYLWKLSKVVNMNVLQDPFSYPAHDTSGGLIGYGGWIHWATSGAHVYSYGKEWTGTGKHLFTVDCYTCKPFSCEAATEFTRDYFKSEEIVWKEV